MADEKAGQLAFSKVENWVLVRVILWVEQKDSSMVGVMVVETVARSAVLKAHFLAEKTVVWKATLSVGKMAGN